ncbi:MAG: TonB-dependent siderophore receptor, partial [Caulobacteraceae bacterium]|nr:TonB-dependent siderophore receptor [Caulobacteraceae bacterium]
ARHYVPTSSTSATKTDTPLVETPASITVITRDQIDVLGMTNLQQAVRYTAGTLGETFGADSRFDWLTIRGFKPVEFIDGIQAPVGSVSTVGLDLWGAQSIEVLKGPAGVLYGATPPGGIVNYTSRRPEAEGHGEVQGILGTFNNRQIAADVTGSLSGEGVVNGRLTALWRQSDTQITGADVQRAYLAPAVSWNISERAHFTVLGFYQRDENNGGDGGFLPALGTLLPNPNGKIPVKTNVGEPGYNFFGRELYGVGYEYSHAFGEHVTFVQNLKYMRQNENFVSVYGTGLQSDNRTLNRSNFIFPEDIRNFGVDTRLQIAAQMGAVEHAALIGVDYLDVKNDTDFLFGSAPSIDIYNPVYGAAIPAPFFVLRGYINSESKQTGIYAQDTIKYDRWRVTLNARQDHLTGPVKDDAFTWRAGLNYIFESGLAPYVAYATSFQPVGGADFGGNPFSPTTGKQFEAGLKFEPRHMPRSVKWYAAAAVYQLTQENVLTNDPAHLFFSVQQGEVEVKGLELESVARIRERLSINASYSYTDSEVTKSNGADLHKQLPAVPKNKASVLVDYTFQTGPWAGLGGGVGVRYLGPGFGDAANALKSEAETLADLLIHYDRSNWRLALNANNLFDKVYVQSCSDLNTCFYSQRRQVMVTLGRKW